MIVGWWASALAAPVVGPGPGTPEGDALTGLDRCRADSEAVGGTLPDPGELHRTDRLAIVIGVPCHRMESVPALAYAGRDAVRVGEALAAGGFTVLPLLNVVDKAEVESALRRAAAALTPDGTLVVYFSGHGVLRDDEGRVRRYLVLSDTDLNAITTTGLSVRALDGMVSALPVEHHVIVQDTCFAARGPGKGLGVLEPTVHLEEGDLRLFASRFFEQAVESHELRASLYTGRLLGALSDPAADLDGDGCVGLVEAHFDATDRVAEERDGFQVPQMQARTPENLLLGCAPHAPTRAVLQDPGGESVLTLLGPDGAAWQVGSVPPGRYHVRLTVPRERDGELVYDPILAGSIALSAGEWVDLRDEAARRQSLLALELQGGFIATTETGRAPVGVEGLWMTRDLGSGRIVTGLAGRTALGGGIDPATRWEEFEVMPAAGWSFRLDPSGAASALRRWRAGVGPEVAVGAVGRTVGSDARPVEQGPFAATAGDAQIRLWASRTGFFGSLAAGVRVLPLYREGALHFEASPAVRIGVGPAL